MNCKQGDLCFYIGIDSRDWGRIVETKALYFSDGEPMWEVDPPLHVNAEFGSGLADGVLDRLLRPIRDSEDPDETITWAGKPNETPTQIIKEIA